MAKWEATQNCKRKYKDYKPRWKPWNKTDKETLLDEMLVTMKKNLKKKGRFGLGGWEEPCRGPIV